MVSDVRINDCRLLAALGGVTWCPCVRCPHAKFDVGGEDRGPGVKTPLLIRSKLPYGKSLAGDVGAAVLALGRKCEAWPRLLLYSELNFLLLDAGREASLSDTWPNTRPAAAAAMTVPVPTSCVAKVSERHENAMLAAAVAARPVHLGAG